MPATLPIAATTARRSCSVSCGKSLRSGDFAIYSLARSRTIWRITVRDAGRGASRGVGPFAPVGPVEGGCPRAIKGTWLADLGQARIALSSPPGSPTASLSGRRTSGQVEEAENLLRRELSFREVRVRHHGPVARIEIASEEVRPASYAIGPRAGCAAIQNCWVFLRLHGPGGIPERSNERDPR